MRLNRHAIVQEINSAVYPVTTLVCGAIKIFLCSGNNLLQHFTHVLLRDLHSSCDGGCICGGFCRCEGVEGGTKEGDVGERGEYGVSLLRNT